ncbi:hypothetical protein EVAR_73462_1 [Eumeta japonica]|uniref:Uncharacterized protein n=1 Tax=Eumeta variegata TaxID=151549 RepID=A0A4C1SEV7_EUMVA|nr:hypothetical protein EVAR_73462_1 [Eumeta japonica]
MIELRFLLKEKFALPISLAMILPSRGMRKHGLALTVASVVVFAENHLPTTDMVTSYSQAYMSTSAGLEALLKLVPLYLAVHHMAAIQAYLKSQQRKLKE